MLKSAILIAGPTASGKSALALALARATGGIVVNADSMQVYSVLSILTARPGPDELAAAPHRLYGHVHPAKAYSVGQWLEDVERLIKDETFRDRMPIFVGGTGLYFRALTQGLSPIPKVADDVRELWRSRLEREGAEKLHGLLENRDPASAQTIRPADGQRIVRALEVLDASGKPLSAWQKLRSRPLLEPQSAGCIVLEPDRAFSVSRIETRFDEMVEAGALKEVEALLDLQLEPDLPAMKAIGVNELAASLRGDCTLAAAIARSKIATRQYAKRQATWFRHQLGAEWQRFSYETGTAFSKLCERILTQTKTRESPVFKPPG